MSKFIILYFGISLGHEIKIPYHNSKTQFEL